MHTVLIAEDNQHWLSIVTEVIGADPDFQVVAATNNGRVALERVIQFRPDILMLDIIMPEVDGISIVQHIRQEMPDYQPIIYILSGMGTDSTIQILNDLNISFYSLKPADVNLVLKHLKKIVLGRATPPKLPEAPAVLPISAVQPNSTDRVTSMIRQMGISPHLLSSKYLADAILMCEQDDRHLNSLTKRLYPAVAKKHDTKPASIERGIRSAIQQMRKAETPLFVKLFQQGNGQRLSNGEFLFVAVHFLSQKAG